MDVNISLILSRIFYSYRDVTIYTCVYIAYSVRAGRNLLPSYPTLVNMVSCEGSPHLVTFQNPGIDNR